MQMNIIVACDREWGIGKNGRLLCHIPGDLKHFKEITMGKTVVMGRVTLESLPGGHGLPGRRNIVLTKNPDFQAEGAEVVHDLDELDKALEGTPTDDVFVIGGANIYSLLYPRCRNMYVTQIEEEFGADRFFPRNLDESHRFEMESHSEYMEENGIRYRFVKYVKVPPEGGRR